MAIKKSDTISPLIEIMSECRKLDIATLHTQTDQFDALNKLPDWLLKNVIYPFLDWVLKLDEVDSLIQENSSKKDMEFAKGILDSLDIHAVTAEKELENIPKEGAVIIACNHPMGITDGVILDAIMKVRSDISVLGMEFVSALTNNMDNELIPVNKMIASNERNKEEIFERASQALKDGKVLLIMGSGTGANKKNLGTTGKPVDGKWKTGVTHFALEQNVQIVPAYIEGENDWWYYLIRALSKKASMFFYLRQFLKKSGQRFPIRFGKEIRPKVIHMWKTKIEDEIQNNLHPELDTPEKRKKYPYYAIAQKIRDRVFALADK